MTYVQLAHLRGWRFALFCLQTLFIMLWALRPVLMTAGRRDYLVDFERGRRDYLTDMKKDGELWLEQRCDAHSNQ